ncbi:MAG: 3-deoxy-D-manno-octulosonic acid transferase [Acidobacteria bacterium]|nr:3-deoxy-D-manno-octulosonic acid transferase [Acidobacteriota bacterium]MCI0718097.1 3-deoxy-D-manno-octulosonic acid transferase [Acidobacteriota bacterium]
MHLLYSLAFTLGFISALPYFLFQALLHRKYFSSFWQRLGDLPREISSGAEAGVWIHAVSVGEVLAVLPLVHALQARWPKRTLFISTTTLTGQALARKKLADRARILYFPLDWRFAVRRSLDTVRPSLVLIAETEIWPNFLRECRTRAIPVLLVNGRLSDRSMRRYRRIKGFMQRILDDFSFCCMQTEMDRDRLLSLGAKQTKVEVCGNLKYEIAAPESIQAKTKAYRQLLGLAPNRFVVVAGSTMKDEEALVLAAFDTLRACCPEAILVIAPRHPERFREVEKLLSDRSVSYAKRSELNHGRPRGNQDAQVVLLDSLGELATLYALASVVFIGGSLVPTGGHNILEPALFQKPILFGPHMSNFREMSEYFLQQQAAVQVNDAAELGDGFIKMFRDAELRQRIGDRGQAILTAHRGAAQRIVNHIESIEVRNPKFEVRTGE